MQLPIEKLSPAEIASQIGLVGLPQPTEASRPQFRDHGLSANGGTLEIGRKIRFEILAQCEPGNKKGHTILGDRLRYLEEDTLQV